MSNKIEMGDFQTPAEWAEVLTKLLPRLGIKKPSIVVEPTCGVGAFVQAAVKTFPKAQVFGFDINQEYVNTAQEILGTKAEIVCDSFFNAGYMAPLDNLDGEVLFLGNPPWVTNSKLGSLESENLPEKKNITSLRGIDAITGKANFDISEWMICRLVDLLQFHSGSVAMIVKSSVARKVLEYVSSKKIRFGHAKFIPLDAKDVFDVSVDCGFFVFTATNDVCYEIEVLDMSLKTIGKYGDRNGKLVSNIIDYDRWIFLDGINIEKWRSGVKHDCSAIFEFRKVDDRYVNGNGDVVDIEDTYLYPLLKSSDLANGRLNRGDRFVLITQKSIGQETLPIRELAPKTWKYLTAHRHLLEARKSSIYRNKPAFSIFGVGAYSFAPWKVAISGLYKSLNFVKLSPQDSKAIMVDDTCYFLPCESEEKADAIMALLASAEATAFLKSIIFWDAKRPVSADVLQRLKLDQVPSASAALYRSEVELGS